MKIKLTDLNNVMNKVSVATNKDDLVRIAFGQTEQAGNKINLISFLANNGAGLQVQANMAYAGNAHPNGTYTVKASVMNSILKAYEALGIEFVSLEGTEGQLFVKNDNGKQGLQVSDKKVGEIGIKETQVGALYALNLNLKELVAGVKSVAYAIDPDVSYSNGIYFEATESGFKLSAIGKGYGAQSNIKATFTKDISKEPFSRDFFILPTFVKLLNVLKGNKDGEVTGYVSDKYLVLRDGEGTLCIVTLSGAQFPKKDLEKVFVKKDQPLTAVEGFDFTIKKKILEAATQLAECTTANKAMLIKAIKMGETVELLTGSEANPQTIGDCSVNLIQESAGMVFTTSFMNALLANIQDEKVTIRVANGAYLIVYGGDSTAPSAFLMGRKDSPSVKNANAEKNNAEKETTDKKEAPKAESKQA